MWQGRITGQRGHGIGLSRTADLGLSVWLCGCQKFSGKGQITFVTCSYVGVHALVPVC
jgi:hypothetical protein